MNEPNAPPVVWWLKKDFRLRDNHALSFALKTGSPVLALFVIEPQTLSAPETSAMHVAAWVEATKHLHAAIRAAGGDLLILREDVLKAFALLHSQTKFERLVSHEEIGELRTYRRDIAVGQWCRSRGVEWIELRQTGVFRRLKNRDQRSKLWKSFMEMPAVELPKASELSRLIVPEVVSRLPAVAIKRLSVKSLGLELSPAQARYRQRVSEEDAIDTLDTFLTQRGMNYSSEISSPNTAFSSGSRLSVHLAWGTISPRYVYQQVNRQMEVLKDSDDPNAGRWRRSLNAFKARMNWRDHFIQRLETEPQMEQVALNAAYDQLPKPSDPKILEAWVKGETGLPLVDACIRCAQTTGFLNFRMRCMITSVACHALRLSWRDIHVPMARWWADYEPGIHLAQLQMQAGVVGINTLRTYNPAKQIADQDPDAKFIRRWLPELKKVDVETIIDHQDNPTPLYIRPIVNWRESTTAMRADYYAIRRMPETKKLAEAVLAKHGSRKKPSKRRKAAVK
ncbi:deoxyribodipyrimidine photo-lyase [Rhodopirellula rubra]|uniref:Deoxyribodipyrimidine photo-lyase n=1 Tax=Aporhodopirellula rubra TaxID=980271 RepID=A0A7W5H895_9BACT|nr:FAD-binding domain-containing protein [Aporhodopirellula rubra]MBB3209199.1 deoxyribodipyrimidine photo-lyase [Aporhodopirellula rubra]